MSQDANTLEAVRCPECGKDLPASQRICFCGNDLRTPRAPAPEPGVGGWLLYFCLQLFLLNPLLIGAQVVGEARALVANDALATPAGVMIGVDCGARLLLLALGIASGVLLVIRHPRAVGLVCAYLVLFGVVHFLLVGLPFLFGLPSPLRDKIVGMYLYRAAMTVPATSFWLLYFKHSRRVKLTYPVEA